MYGMCVLLGHVHVHVRRSRRSDSFILGLGLGLLLRGSFRGVYKRLVLVASPSRRSPLFERHCDKLWGRAAAWATPVCPLPGELCVRAPAVSGRGCARHVCAVLLYFILLLLTNIVNTEKKARSSKAGKAVL